MKIRIAISMGDPAGIGPEIILKSLANRSASVTYRIFGQRHLFELTAASLGLPMISGHNIEWIETSDEDPKALLVGQINAFAGRIQVLSLEGALNAVLQGDADALCTAPITKAAARLAGFPFPGHTEYLASRCSTPRYVMMLAGPVVRVVPITGHIALSAVPRELTVEKVATALEVTATALSHDLKVDEPNIALAALNPHAGEQGMFGNEEEKVLLPALELAVRNLATAGICASISGPHSADSLFVHPGRYDAYVCAYHDQALIPLKMHHPDDSVNVTLGLPIVRTSPAHGSALDIAGRGIARPHSFHAALDLAEKIASLRAKMD